MKNLKQISLLFLAAMTMAGCVPTEKNTKENDDQIPEDVHIWANITDGDKHVHPGDLAKMTTSISYGLISESRSWSGSAWKNDHAASRLDFLTFEESFPQVSIETMDLVSEDGATISKDNITTGFLAPVNTKSVAYPNIDYQVYDIITRNSVKDFSSECVYSAWVDIFVPKTAQKGIYKGKLKVKSADRLIVVFDYELEVFDFTLTEPEEWETFLDLWGTPFASNRYYSGKTDMEFFQFTTPEDQDTNPFSLYYCHLDPKYQAGLESELELYHQAGGNAISVQVVEAPDNSRHPCATPSMVKWMLKKDGTFTWDYTDMDYWVELNLKHKINRQINLFYHTGVGYGFVYYDESTGQVTNKLSAHPGTERYAQISKLFLQDLVNHLEQKGWFDMAVLYMDERLYEVTKAMIEVAESVHNSKGVTLKAGGAVNGDEVEPLYDRMYDVSMWELHKGSHAREIAESRRAKGLQTTIYSCGSGKMSSINQPAESAFAVYEAKKYGMDGVMRWALNKYDLEPIYGTLHTTCYPGDCYLIYPDERDSAQMQAQTTPRFEKLREGMRTMEKINIIKKTYPEYAAQADAIISSLGSTMVEAAAAVRSSVRNLSKEIQNTKK